MHQKIKFIPMKIHKIVTTRAAHFGPDMHQIVCRTPLGELTALPRPLAGLRGPTSKGGEGRGGAATLTFAPGGTNARAATVQNTDATLSTRRNGQILIT